MSNPKIGILGSGIVGQVLASAFLAEGHETMLSARSANKEDLQRWKARNSAGKIGSFAEAAAFAEIVVLAVKGLHAENALLLSDIENLAGKIIIDTTNPIDDSVGPDHGVLRFFTGINESLMERLQTLVPAAKFVKAFNSAGNGLMYNPALELRPTMFIAGNDAEAKQTVTAILDKFGWEAEDMGSAEGARAIEPLCILWCIPGFLRNQWSHAFKLLK